MLAPSEVKFCSPARNKSPSPVLPSFPASLRYGRVISAVAATIRGGRSGRASLPPGIRVDCE